MDNAKSLEAMKLPELKKRVWNAWTRFNQASGVVTQPKNYVHDVKQFGDRRYKVTWIKALAHFSAQASYESCLDAYMLVLNSFNFTPDRWDYEYRHEILDAFLMYPNGLELIKTGLEQLLELTPQEQDEAHGFFELVEERGTQPGRDRLPIGFNRTLASTYSAA
ncbi:MAG: hypothetical protein F6K11_15045 [Leptolyngbya sp. SIO3F4]|nr:hypothetical protein [Leptolyngbya sp. SIO3F4]